MRDALSAGRASARTRSGGDPDLAATASAVAGPSPVSSQTSMPASVSARTAAADSGLTGSPMAMRPAARPTIAT